jgi:hypothetical protein
MIVIFILLSGCKPAVYGGLEAQTHGKYEGSEWENSNPTAFFGIEFDEILDEYMLDNFGIRARLEHKSDPSTRSDGWGKNLGRGEIYYEFK